MIQDFWYSQRCIYRLSVKNSPLLAEERVRNGTDPKRASALRGSSVAEESAIRWTSKLCMFPCRPLAVSMCTRNAKIIGPGADNKGKMPKDKKRKAMQIVRSLQKWKND